MNDIEDAVLGEEHDLPDDLVEAFDKVIVYLRTQPFEERSFLAASEQPDGFYVMIMSLHKTGDAAEVH